MKVVLPRINTPSMDTTYWCTMINARLKGQCIYLLNFLFIMEKYIESNKYLENLHSHSKKGGSDDTSNGSTHRVAQRPPSMCWIEDVKSSWRGIVTSVYHYGEKVYVSCRTGYHMKGDRIISCMQPGQWHPTMPTCEGNHLSSSMYFIKLTDFIDQRLIWRLRKCISHLFFSRHLNVVSVCTSKSWWTSAI